MKIANKLVNNRLIKMKIKTFKYQINDKNNKRGNNRLLNFLQEKNGAKNP